MCYTFDRYLMTEMIEKAIKFLVNMSRRVRKNGLHNEISAHNMIKSNAQYITKTCPCNVYPLEPHFYIAKLGYARVYLFFLFLLRGGSNVYPQSMF